ncbi:hypothetical protein RJ640_018445 [Escallonia rubra]|uniref:Chromo domain-containing protein n=1 Tax=Escallonia rubra TaxID=112253 RepID=A0AA88UCJ6_9ASTE|nr:hypothetical protein RJ640_018445 [Escallonia rubra]
MDNNRYYPHTVNVPNAGKSPRAISFSEEWRQNIDLAHSYLEKVARRMKKHADKNRRSQEFNVGDKVMVKLLPQDRKFLRGRDSRLLKKYEGPLTIGKKIGKMAYKVDPPAPSRLSPSRKRHQEYLVKWHGYMDEENTWERAVDLSAYTDKIEAYHMQKLKRASTALVGENVTGYPLHPPSTTPLHPSCTAPSHQSNTHPCTLIGSSFMVREWVIGSSFMVRDVGFSTRRRVQCFEAGNSVEKSTAAQWPYRYGTSHLPLCNQNLTPTPEQLRFKGVTTQSTLEDPSNDIRPDYYTSKVSDVLNLLEF